MFKNKMTPKVSVRKTLGHNPVDASSTVANSVNQQLLRILFWYAKEGC